MNRVMFKSKLHRARITEADLYYEGSLTISWDPSVKPSGSMSHVAHLVSRNGNAFTNVQLPPITMPVDLFALLPDSARKVIQRQVVP